jgi:hypothetical protein
MTRLIALISPLLLIVFVSSCGPTKTPDGVADVHDPAQKPAAGAADKMVAGKAKQPERPPEFFGVVERVEKRSIANSAEFEAVLIKGHPPLVGMPKPSSPLIQDGKPDHLWLNLTDITTVERRSGPIVVGQYVWVWHAGEYFLTDPAQIYPEFVISESVLPK